MDAERVHMLRELLAGTGWAERTRGFARSLRRANHAPGGLLLVGTPQEEPWHLAAHLDDEARFSSIPELSPTLVRWSPPAGAPPHLSVGLERLEKASRKETLFVVAPDAPPEQLLERVADAKRIGATILSIDEGDDELAALAHERLVVPTDSRLSVATPELSMPTVDMDAVQHLVSVAAGESSGPTSFRERLARLLENISGPAPKH